MEQVQSIGVGALRGPDSGGGGRRGHYFPKCSLLVCKVVHKLRIERRNELECVVGNGLIQADDGVIHRPYRMRNNSLTDTPEHPVVRSRKSTRLNSSHLG